MTKKRIYIINGHPAESSLSRSFAEDYKNAAEQAGHEVRLLHLRELEFDSDFGYGGFSETKPLEPGLKGVLEDLKWCQHFVVLSPMWWGGLPAKLKGLIDRAFLPGEVFDTRTSKLGLPLPLLEGRTGRVFLTSDTPGWFMGLIYRNALLHQLRKQILGFVGIKPVRITHFSGASHPKEGIVEGWAQKVRSFARSGI